MLHFPFTDKIEYLEDPIVRKTEADTFVNFWHSDIGSDNIVLGTKFFAKNKEGETFTCWKQGFFSDFYAKEATDESKNAFVTKTDKKTGEKTKKRVNKLINNPGIDHHVNLYTSVNRYPDGCDRGFEKNVSFIEGLFFDIDIHRTTSEEIDKSLGKVIGSIMGAVCMGKLPHFNMVVLTGAGLALYVKYSKPVSTEDREALGFHAALYEKLLDVLENVLSKAGLSETVKVDTSVRNINRNCRVPGSWHTDAEGLVERWATLYAIDKECVGLEELCETLRVTEPKYKDGLKPEKKEKKPVNEVEDIEVVDIDRASFSLAARKCAERRLEQFEEILKLRNGGRDGDKRHFLVFLYWNFARMIYAPLVSVNMLYAYNDHLKEPVEEEYINHIINGPYWIIKPENCARIMCLTDEEAKALKFFENRDKKEAAKKNKEVRPEKVELAKKMWNEDFASAKEVALAIGVNRDTVYEWIKVYGWISPEDRKALIKKQKEDEKNKAKAAKKAAKELTSAQKSKKMSDLSDFGVSNNKKIIKPETKSNNYYENNNQDRSNNQSVRNNQSIKTNHYENNNQYRDNNQCNTTTDYNTKTDQYGEYNSLNPFRNDKRYSPKYKDKDIYAVKSYYGLGNNKPYGYSRYEILSKTVIAKILRYPYKHKPNQLAAEKNNSYRCKDPP